MTARTAKNNMACIKSSLGRDFLKYCWQLNVLAVVDAFGCCLFLALVNPSIQVLKNGELPPEVHQEGTGGRENCSSLLTPRWLHTVSLSPVTLWCLTLLLESVTPLRLSLSPCFSHHTRVDRRLRGGPVPTIPEAHQAN